MAVNLKHWLLVALILTGIIFLSIMPQPFPAHLTKVDFQAYWGASYLLANSENFSDPVRLLEVQQALAGWNEDTPQMTWNPPWLLVLLIPLTLLTFDRASWIWFLANISLVFTSTVLLWRLYAKEPETNRYVGLGLVVAFLFLPTLTTLLIGQVSALVLFGLAGFLYFERQRQMFYAGLALALVTIKPHLVYITLPVLLLELLWQRQWRSIVGFFAPILVGLAITSTLRPTFLPEYVFTVSDSGLLYRTVPTLGFFLSDVTNWSGFRLMGIVILPVALVFWWYWRRSEPVNVHDLTNLTLLLSVITALFGWSFDVIVFLVPIMQLCIWLLEGALSRLQLVSIPGFFVAANGIALYQRSLQMRDDHFFWFPLVMAGLYIWGWLTVGRGVNAKQVATI